MSNFNNFLKITPAMAKAVGATTDQEFSDKFLALLTSASGFDATAFAKLQTDLAAAQKTIETQATALAANEKTIGELTAKLGNPSLLTEAGITAIATKAGETAGSSEAAKALAATGNHPAAPASAPALPGNASPVAALIAAGKFDEAFAADKNLQAEFITKEGYCAFMKAQAKGQVGRDTIKTQNKNS